MIALSSAMAPEDPAAEARAEYARAEAHFTSGEVEEAVTVLRAAIADPDTSPFWQALMLVRVADLERGLGRPKLALESLDRAQALFDEAQREADVRTLLCSAHGMRGQVYLDWGLVDLAASWFERERELADELATSYPRYRVASNFHRAHLALAVDDYEGLEALTAAAFADEATYAKFPGERAKLAIRLGMGLCELERRDPARKLRARACLEEALADPELNPLERPHAELILAELALRQGDFERARFRLARAEEKMGPGSERDSSHDWPLLYAISARLSIETGAPEAELEARRKDLEGCLDEMARLWEETDPRPGGFGIQHFVRARAPLSELFRLDLGTESNGGGAQRAFERLLDVQTLGSLDRRGGTSVPSLTQLRAELFGRKSDHGLLCWFPGPDRSHLFVLDGAVLEHHELSGRDSLEQARTQLERAFLRGVAGELLGARAEASERAEAALRERHELASKLRAALVPPAVIERMRTWSRLSLVGLDLIGEVPFEALPFDDGFIGTEFAVDVLPSVPFAVSLARRVTPPRGSAPDVVLLAAPGLGDAALELDPTLDELDLAPERIDAIVDAYRPERRRVWTRDDASETRLRDLPAGLPVLQVLTHGAFDRSREVAAALVLGPTGGDGLLRAEEIETLSSPEVVLLTACRAGRGALRRGDLGSADLGGSFLQAGARVVVLSAFDLELEAVLRLSSSFHSGLRRGETPAEALRFARAELARDPRFADPAYHALVRAFGFGHRAVFAR